MSYDEGTRIPPGYHLGEEYRTGLLIAGPSTLVGFYVLGVYVSGWLRFAGSDDTERLYIPVVGPFAAMAGSRDPAPLAIIGAGQCTGLVMTLIGLASKRTVLVRNDIAGSPHEVRALGSPRSLSPTGLAFSF
jgi:hypothetical protein